MRIDWLLFDNGRFDWSVEVKEIEPLTHARPPGISYYWPKNRLANDQWTYGLSQVNTIVSDSNHASRNHGYECFGVHASRYKTVWLKARVQPEYGWMVAVPCSFLCTAFAIPPAAWLIRRAKKRRRRAREAGGLCRNCGYDLRASPGVCPECGARPPSPVPA